MTKNEVRLAQEIIKILRGEKEEIDTGSFMGIRIGYRFNEEQYHFIEPFFKLKLNYTYGIMESKDESLWIGTTAGTIGKETVYFVNIFRPGILKEYLEWLIFFKSRIKYSDAIRKRGETK